MRSAGSGVSAAGASAWARYRALVAEHRRERLVVGVVLAGSAGVVSAGLTGLRAGLVVAVGVFVGHTMYERHRPGRLSGWRRGARAERRTGRHLSGLDPGPFHVLHDRALYGVPGANLDHLVIGLTGVYAIASRRLPWRARLWADEHRVHAGRMPLTNLQSAALRAARTVADLLTAELDHEEQVAVYVAVHGGRMPRDGLPQGGVEFHRARRLPSLIRRRPVVFTSAQVATIAAAAERVLPPMLEVISRGIRTAGP